MDGIKHGFDIAVILFAGLEGKRNEPVASDEAAGNFCSWLNNNVDLQQHRH